MGLDWCVMDKEKPGITEFMVGQARTNLEEAQTVHEECWRAWLEVGGHEPPTSWPNALADAFQKTREAKNLQAKIDEHQEVLNECLISPMETLGAPRVGFDEAATEFAREQYREALKTPWGKERFSGMTEDEYVALEHGKYVPSLLKSDGIALTSGMMVGAESFRGKMLRWCEEVLEGTDLGERAYRDHKPDDLVDYGNALNDAATDYEDGLRDERDREVEDKAEALREAWELDQIAEHDDCEDWPEEPDFEAQARECLEPVDRRDREAEKETREKIDTVRSAARWCLFWGSRGHGMHAWY